MSKSRSLSLGAASLLLSLASACASSDAGSSEKDAAGSTAGARGSKAGTGGASTGNGSSTAGTGSSKNDAGSSKAGTGGSKAEAASSKPDAGGSKPDAGSSKPDAASPKPDAGGSKPDASGTVVTTLPVELGTAGDYVLLAKSGISTVPTAAVTGNLGVSPAAASYITGFSLTADSTNVFSTSPQVTGKVYAADYAVPTPSNMTTAVSDMELAFTDAAGRSASVTELGAGDISGMTLAPGVYKWGTGLMIAKDVTLSGPATAVWIFQVAKNLTLSSATKIALKGGALPKNVFWQVAGNVVLDTTAHLEGIVLCQTAITLRTGASINGRLLAQTDVTIDASTIVEPAR